MTPDPKNWHDVAVAKLTKVLGPVEGMNAANAALVELGLERVTSADELRALAAALERRGGFGAAVGGLLLVHATMYGG